LFENEDMIYPKPKYKGADMLLSVIETARHHGLHDALLELRHSKPGGIKMPRIRHHA
jgi:hypothetical protein